MSWTRIGWPARALSSSAGRLISSLVMCKAVIEVLKAFLTTRFGLKGPEEADAMFKDLQSKGRICYEAWG